MASDGPSNCFPSLRLGLSAHQLSTRRHAQSLLGPSFQDARTPHVLESHPKRAVPLSRRNNEQRLAVSSHRTLPSLSLQPVLQVVCVLLMTVERKNRHVLPLAIPSPIARLVAFSFVLAPWSLWIFWWCLFATVFCQSIFECAYALASIGSSFWIISSSYVNLYFCSSLSNRAIVWLQFSQTRPPVVEMPWCFRFCLSFSIFSTDGPTDFIRQAFLSLWLNSTTMRWLSGKVL